jgi:hypothetical protein
MTVRIGHASIDENGKASGGAAGDQTGKEVFTRDWYSKPWTAVIRPNDSKIAEKIAKAMEQACANDKIGYDQSQRTTLYAQAKACGWDLSKITTACETDCSALVAVCVNAAGVSVSKDIYTGNELNALKATGEFTVYSTSQYTGSSDYLKRGDVLLASGHTAIVLSNGAKASGSGTTTAKATTTATTAKTATEAAQKKSSSLAGTYQATTDLNLRNGAGKNKAAMVVIPSGTKVKNYGYYTEVSGTKWLYIQFTLKGVTYTGFASGKYLKKC